MKALLSSLILFLLVSVASADQICFTDDQASDIIVKLEQGKMCEATVNEYERLDGEERETIDLQKKQIDNLNAQLERDKMKMELYKEIIKDQEDLCKERIKAATPSFFERIGQAVLFIITGAVIGAVAF